MSTPSIPDELWMDVLHEKHECYTHRPLTEREITVAGRNVRLILPTYFADFECLSSASEGDLLFVVGRAKREWDGELFGIVIIARRVAEGTYHAHLWHETYPYLFKYLGISSP